MWLLQYVNFVTGPIIGLSIGALSACVYLAARLGSHPSTQQRLRRTAVWGGVVAVLLTVVTTVLYVPFAMLACFVFDGLLAEWHEELDVQGVVVDAASGEPVADARVVVIADYALFMAYRPYAFATETDDDGAFSAKAELPEPCNGVHVYASTPTDGFAQEEWQSAPLRLTATPPTSDQRDDWRFRHQHFAPEPYARAVTFFCPRWPMRRPTD